MWRAVNDRLEAFGVESPSSALTDLYAARREQVDDLTRPITVQEGQVGAVVEISGAPVALDLVIRPKVFAELLPRLAEGYAIEALCWPGAAFAGPSRSAARSFLGLVLGSRRKWIPTPGMGDSFRLTCRELDGCGLKAYGEFIDAWNAGQRPDIDTYLQRAPDGERDALAERISTWLQIAPAPAYDPAARAQIRQEPPLVAALQAAAARRAPISTRLPPLRNRAGLAISDLARRLAAIFDLDDDARAADYLQRIERDELDERRLSRRLTDALAAILRVDPDQLAVQPQPSAAQAFFRAENDSNQWVAEEIDALSRAALAPAPEPLDELDRLFLGGPGG